MLVPLDGSELAEIVLPYAKELGGRLGLDVTFLHVCAANETELLPMYQAYVEHAIETAAFEPEGAQAGGGAQQTQGKVATGHPAEEILQYADENTIDIILMATHGRSGVRRWVMGSVADKVLRAARVPVLLIKANAAKQVPPDKLGARVLVPLDGSELAECALLHARAISSKLAGADLTLVRVIEPFFLPAPGESDDGGHVYTAEEEQKIKRRHEADAQRYFKQLIANAKLDGGHLHTEILAGEVAEAITGYAEKKGIDLIAMSTHGRSGISRWAWGNVADKVLRSSGVPVLLVRSPACPIGI